MFLRTFYKAFGILSINDLFESGKSDHHAFGWKFGFVCSVCSLAVFDPVLGAFFDPEYCVSALCLWTKVNWSPSTQNYLSAPLSELCRTRCFVICGQLNCPGVVTLPCSTLNRLKRTLFTRSIFKHGLPLNCAHEGNVHVYYKKVCQLCGGMSATFFSFSASCKVNAGPWVRIINDCGWSCACSVHFCIIWFIFTSEIHFSCCATLIVMPHLGGVIPSVLQSAHMPGPNVRLK